MPNLIGLHDRESVAIAAPDTWVLHTTALSENPQPNYYDPAFHWITRLNWGYGSTGTLPVVDQYQMFAERVAAYVSASSGCHRWQIGNEPNLRREWPDQIPIYPWHYSACFKLCRQAIKALPGHEYDEVLIAGSGPWNAELTYMSNPHGDWIQYFAECIDLCDGQLDGTVIHSYCHGYDPALVTSTARMDAPFQNRFYNFRAYQDYCAAIPDYLRHLPVYIGEANGDGPWEATGLMTAMLEEINSWNYSGNLPLIRSVIFYRYPQYDIYFIERRDDVIAEYQGAASRGYISPSPDEPPPFEPEPEPPDEYLLEWDPRLDLRGAQLGVVESNAPTEWHVTVGRWFDEQQAQGRINCFVTVLDEDGELVANVPVRWFWQDGEEIKYTEIKYDPWLGSNYSLDFAMYAVAPAYGVQIFDEEPTDIIGGLGLGSIEQPQYKIHTCYSFVFQRIKTSDDNIPTPPYPGQIEAGVVTATAGLNLRAQPNTEATIYGTLAYRSTVLYDREQDGWLHVVDGWVSGKWVGEVEDETPPFISDGLEHPLPGCIITQHFYQHREMYEQFGLIGHDGTDLAGLPMGTPVLCMAAGRVTRADWDDAYGNYIMVRHDHLLAYTMYCHASELLVTVGQQVQAGQPLMLLGSTGNSSGPHLHLSVRMMDPDGSYKENTPMPGGRVDPQTWAYMYGLEL